VEKVLIVEDELNARTGLAELIGSWGYRTAVAADGVEALEQIAQSNPGIVVTDLKMPRMDGMELLHRIGDLPRRIAVVMLTAQGSIESAVEAMRLGAFDYIPKPIDPIRLCTVLKNVSQENVAQQHIADAELQTAPKPRPAGTLGLSSPLVGSSARMQEIFRLVERIAPSNVSVLVTGESGTGKELVARALHDLSGRRDKPFIAVNCAAIPETLIESEIFGHEKGAFTGADARRAGCFELAEGGTLLLDEIGEMPAPTQTKLLRVLEDRKLRRLGSKTETPVDVRIVAATNKDPQTAVANGELRGDLYYRLNVFNICMPSLREHKQDIPALAAHLIEDMNRKHGTSVTGLSPSLLARIEDHSWPGNVRELRNTLERAVILAGDGTLDLENLSPDFGQIPHQDHVDSIKVSVGTTVNIAEKQLILKTLTSTQNNKTKAAEILGISVKTLQNKLKEYASHEA
jgi:DNA-binding NtrC family response regulator